jgi:hypothetical protein
MKIGNIERTPGFKLSVLDNEESRALFLEAMSWVVKEISPK